MLSTNRRHHLATRRLLLGEDEQSQRARHSLRVTCQGASFYWLVTCSVCESISVTSLLILDVYKPFTKPVSRCEFRVPQEAPPFRQLFRLRHQWRLRCYRPHSSRRLDANLDRK